jgi:hypothetical protein
MKEKKKMTSRKNPISTRQAVENAIAGGKGHRPKSWEESCKNGGGAVSPWLEADAPIETVDRPHESDTE